jgi:hypothetical protein
MFARISIFVLTLALLSAVIAKRPNWREIDNYSFDAFIKDFGVKYTSSEFTTRKNIFTTELSRVKLHNAKNLGWKEGNLTFILFFTFQCFQSFWF